LSQITTTISYMFSIYTSLLKIRHDCPDVADEDF